MAAGAAPAPEKTAADATTAIAQETQSQPKTLKERIFARLHQIFHGRDEYLGWRQ